MLFQNLWFSNGAGAALVCDVVMNGVRSMPLVAAAGRVLIAMCEPYEFHPVLYFVVGSSPWLAQCVQCGSLLVVFVHVL